MPPIDAPLVLAAAGVLPGAAAARAPAAAPVPATPPAWTAGQLLSAMVTGRAGDGTVTLQLPDRALAARTDLGLTPGETLRLRVERVGDPLVLKVLDRPGRPAGDVAAEALRLALPRQRPLGAALGQALAAAATASRAAPDAAAAGPRGELAAVLERSLAPALGVEPRALRAAVERSGLFLEARLALAARAASGAVAAGVRDDVKAALLRLRARAAGADPAPARAPEPAPAPAGRAGTAPGPGRAASPDRPGTGTDPAARPAGGPPAAAARAELAAALDAGVRRIETQQVLTARGAEGGAQTWHLDLPLRTPGDGVDTARLRIDAREGGSAEAQERVWSVELSVEPPGLGPTHARVTFAGGRLSVMVWAESEAAAGRIDAALGELGARLEAAGLELAALRCACGEPPGDPVSPAMAGLLSARA